MISILCVTFLAYNSQTSPVILTSMLGVAMLELVFEGVFILIKIDQ